MKLKPVIKNIMILIAAGLGMFLLVLLFLMNDFSPQTVTGLSPNLQPAFIITVVSCCLILVHQLSVYLNRNESNRSISRSALITIIVVLALVCSYLLDDKLIPKYIIAVFGTYLVLYYGLKKGIPGRSQEICRRIWHFSEGITPARME